MTIAAKLSNTMKCTRSRAYHKDLREAKANGMPENLAKGLARVAFHDAKMAWCELGDVD